MGNALDGIASLNRSRKGIPVKKKVVEKPIAAKPVQEDEPSLEEMFKQKIVRTPRTTPASQQKRVDKLVGGAAIMDTKVGTMAKNQVTQERREWVLSWMLNGHQHGGRLMTERQLAIALDCDEMLIKADIAALKGKMSEFFVDENNTEIAALAYILMEMKFQDRGRALTIYNTIVGDIESEDERARDIADKVKKRELPMEALKYQHRLTGRDRAAMYGSALQALDLSNKATNGIDSLFKMAGGAQKLQNLLKARNVQVNIHNGNSYNLQSLQEFASKAMGAVIPSDRYLTGQSTPTTLELTPEEKKVMEIGEKK